MIVVLRDFSGSALRNVATLWGTNDNSHKILRSRPVEPHRNTVSGSLQKGHSLTLDTRPTKIQETAFNLLEIDPVRVR